MDISWGQPVKFQGEIYGTSNSNGTEEIIQDVALLAGQGKSKFSLLEAVDLRGQSNVRMYRLLKVPCLEKVDAKIIPQEDKGDGE